MTAIGFITGHVVYNLAYNQILQTRQLLGRTLLLKSHISKEVEKMYTKNLLTAANSITLELLELVTPCNLLVGIMALFSINGRSGTPVLYAPLKIQKCNLKGVVLFFQSRHPPPKQAY